MSLQFTDIDHLTIKTLKALSVDQVTSANSGHPGAPLGLASAALVVWRLLKINPKNSNWIDRDRFVLSNGHACALVYSLLHITGFNFTIDDLKHFRQVESKTPGHPEFGLPGIEVTTGPLGQGISNAVGLAIAQKNLAATYNRDNFNLIDSNIFVFLGDGCLQEGVSSETCSLAGHLQLDNLIVIYDANHITIDGDIALSFSEDVLKRFQAYGWHTQEVTDGNDLHSIANAINVAKKYKSQPSLIKLTTIIGEGSLNQGSASVHGSPLKLDDVKQLKEHLGFDPNQSFIVPQEVYDHVKKVIVEPNIKLNEQWNNLFEDYQKQYPELGAQLKRRLEGQLPENWSSTLPLYKPEDSSMATRKLSEAVLEKVHSVLPELIGGSADLTPSNLTRYKSAIDFQPPSTGLGNYAGNYIRFGVREHGMGAILNGISAFGANYKPYGGTFLNFVSYGAGACRLAALSGHPVIWIATHDSIGLGEDGPTHQPIETLTHLRAIPNLQVWRPADGNETSAAYKKALESQKTPSVIALSRQNLPQLQGSDFKKAMKGGYIIHDVESKPDLILVSTGSEVHICIETASLLKEQEDLQVRVVSLPDLHTFDKQPQEYKLLILPDDIPILSVEAGATTGWCKYSHEQFGIDRFGSSGKGPEVYKLFQMTPEGISQRAHRVVKFYEGRELLSPLKKALL